MHKSIFHTEFSFWILHLLKIPSIYYNSLIIQLNSHIVISTFSIKRKFCKHGIKFVKSLDL